VNAHPKLFTMAFFSWPQQDDVSLEIQKYLYMLDAK
jgi:hypothetical protein